MRQRPWVALAVAAAALAMAAPAQAGTVSLSADGKAYVFTDATGEDDRVDVRIDDCTPFIGDAPSTCTVFRGHVSAGPGCAVRDPDFPGLVSCPLTTLGIRGDLGAGDDTFEVAVPGVDVDARGGGG